MNGPKDNLYSIEDAKALSLRLSGAGTYSDKADAPSYIRFSAGTPAHARVAPPERTRESIVPDHAPPLPAEPFKTWEDMLKWCSEVTRAKSSFVVDPQGFILMREGEDSTEDGFEGAGANLQLATTHLREMSLDSGDVQMMDITCAGKGILVVQVFDASKDIFTLCFVGYSSVTRAQKKRLYEQIQQSVLKMT